jgi:hypothetical protein
VLLEQYGEAVALPKTRKPGRPRKPYKQWPEGAVYATVNKTYRKGKVAAVDRKLVHGTEEDLAEALRTSTLSGKINTAFVERQNGTDRCLNARKVRKTYQFSKKLLLHIAVTWWVMFCYNFHFPNRGIRVRLSDGSFLHRTPAMAAGLAEKPLAVSDILVAQLVGFTPPATPTLADFHTRGLPGPAP